MCICIVKTEILKTHRYLHSFLKVYYVYVYMYICVCVYIYIYIYIYIYKFDQLKKTD